MCAKEGRYLLRMDPNFVSSSLFKFKKRYNSFFFKLNTFRQKSNLIFHKYKNLYSVTVAVSGMHEFNFRQLFQVNGNIREEGEVVKKAQILSARPYSIFKKD